MKRYKFFSDRPEFNKSSKVSCDGQVNTYKVYKLPIKGHATNLYEALKLIESGDSKSMFFFLNWNRILKVWEASTVTWYYKKDNWKDNILISSDETVDVNKDKLIKKLSDYVLVKC